MKSHFARASNYYPVMRDIYLKLVWYTQLTGYYESENFFLRVHHEKDLGFALKLYENKKVSWRWLFDFAIELENDEVVQKVIGGMWALDILSLIEEGEDSDYYKNKAIPMLKRKAITKVSNLTG